MAATELTPFRSVPGRNFPVVVSFVGADGDPGPSGLDPDRVADVLGPAIT